MRGFSTLSLLVSLAVCSAVAIATSASLINQLRALTKAKIERLNISNTLTITSVLEGVMHDIDSTTLPISVRIHPAGRITDTDGVLNTISSRNDLLAPNSSSDAISAYSLATGQTLDVVQAYLNSSEIRACSRYPGHLSIAPLRTVLGIAPHAIWEFKVVSKNPRRLARCVTLRLAPTHSMIVASPGSNDLAWVRSIIPVGRTYTLYHDRRGTLRYLGHTGSSNIENQPIATQILGIRFSLATSPDRLLTLSSSLELPTRLPYTILTTSQLARRNIFFSLLARP